jgi:hypothetical protein
MELDYATESKKMADFQKREDLAWFSPEAGKHLVKIVELAQTYEVKKDDKVIIKKRIVVEVMGVKMNWGVPIGKTGASLWGGLVIAGQKLGGLEGKTLTILVKSDGKKRDYNVLESM